MRQGLTLVLELVSHLIVPATHPAAREQKTSAPPGGKRLRQTATETVGASARGKGLTEAKCEQTCDEPSSKSRPVQPPPAAMCQVLELRLHRLRCRRDRPSSSSQGRTRRRNSCPSVFFRRRKRWEAVAGKAESKCRLRWDYTNSAGRLLLIPAAQDGSSGRTEKQREDSRPRCRWMDGRALQTWRPAVPRRTSLAAGLLRRDSHSAHAR